MAKRRLTNYTAFVASYLRARLHQGMTQAQRNQAMRDAAVAWRRGKRGQNPFPEVEIEIKHGEDSYEGPEQAACPECGEYLQIPEGLDGEIVACPQCGAELAVEAA